LDTDALLVTGTYIPTYQRTIVVQLRVSLLRELTMGTKIDLFDEQLIHHKLEETTLSAIGRSSDNGYHTSTIFDEARSISGEDDDMIDGSSSRVTTYSRFGSIGVSQLGGRPPA
jgi:hypothetical protein